MASSKPNRGARKRRKARRARSAGISSAASTGSAPAPARQPTAPRREATIQGALATTLTGRTYGEPPPNPFGGFPASELAIFAGAVGVIVGYSTKTAPALVVGIIVCALGVAEVTAREHFSGYRSHSALLAGIPAVGVGVAMIALFGGSLRRGLLLPVVIVIFAVLFWVLRRRFRTARQARLVRPPVP
jgi:hypothetical protein